MSTDVCTQSVVSLNGLLAAAMSTTTLEALFFANELFKKFLGHFS